MNSNRKGLLYKLNKEEEIFNNSNDNNNGTKIRT